MKKQLLGNFKILIILQIFLFLEVLIINTLSFAADVIVENKGTILTTTYSFQDGNISLKDKAVVNIEATLFPSEQPHGIRGSHILKNIGTLQCASEPCIFTYSEDISNYNIPIDFMQDIVLSWSQDLKSKDATVIEATLELLGRDGEKFSTSNLYGSTFPLIKEKSDVINFSESQIVNKNYAYLVARESGISFVDTAAWRISSAAEQTVMQKIFDIPLSQIQSLQLESKNPIERIQFSIDSDGNGIRDKFLLSEDCPSRQNFDTKTGKYSKQISLIRAIQKHNWDVSKVKIKEVIIFIPSITPEQVKHQNPLFTLQLFTNDIVSLYKESTSNDFFHELELNISESLTKLPFHLKAQRLKLRIMQPPFSQMNFSQIALVGPLLSYNAPAAQNNAELALNNLFINHGIDWNKFKLSAWELLWTGEFSLVSENMSKIVSSSSKHTEIADFVVTPNRQIYIDKKKKASRLWYLLHYPDDIIPESNLITAHFEIIENSVVKKIVFPLLHKSGWLALPPDSIVKNCKLQIDKLDSQKFLISLQQNNSKKQRQNKESKITLRPSVQPSSLYLSIFDVTTITRNTEDYNIFDLNWWNSFTSKIIKPVQPLQDEYFISQNDIVLNNSNGCKEWSILFNIPNNFILPLKITFAKDNAFEILFYIIKNNQKYLIEPLAESIPTYKIFPKNIEKIELQLIYKGNKIFPSLAFPKLHSLFTKNNLKEEINDVYLKVPSLTFVEPQRKIIGNKAFITYTNVNLLPLEQQVSVMQLGNNWNAKYVKIFGDKEELEKIEIFNKASQKLANNFASGILVVIILSIFICICFYIFRDKILKTKNKIILTLQRIYQIYRLLPNIFLVLLWSISAYKLPQQANDVLIAKSILTFSISVAGFHAFEILLLVLKKFLPSCMLIKTKNRYYAFLASLFAIIGTMSAVLDDSMTADIAYIAVFLCMSVALYFKIKKI